ncbi:hypothetical protein Tco_0579056 [Tanacetum coccineum]
MDTPLDFSAFVMNRLKVDTLTLELLTGPTFELMKGSCKSLVELEYLFEEVYKETTEQFDWNNPEECGVKCRLDMTNMHSGESHIRGENNNNSMDLLLTGNLLEMDDDKLYKFKEDDFNRLRIQYIEDILLLLVQGKLTNLTIEERIAFNVSLRMFTRSVVIQRRVEDLQLRCRKGYQKKAQTSTKLINKMDSMHSTLSMYYDYGAHVKGELLSDTQVITMKMEILLESTSNKLMVGDLCDSIRIKLVTTGKKRWCDSIRIKLVPGETVTHWFTLIVLSALRRSDNENMLSRSSRIRRLLKDGGEGT